MPVAAQAASEPASPVDAGAPAADAAIAIGHARVNPEAAHHLAAAEAARRAGKWLVQIEEADAALQADPHSTRARFLVGDGLITTGDLEHGCKYLRDLGRTPAATARARAAGCPSD
jgi:hypothetical protein